jgi:hypothetical protein
MNRVVDQPVLPGGDLDALLGTFFKGEMRQPWPAFQPPQKRRRTPSKPAKHRRFALGSRLALAASVLVLLLCGWVLSGKFPTPYQPNRPTLSDPNAETRPPGKVKSNLSLEQDATGTGIRVDVEEVAPKK